MQVYLSELDSVRNSDWEIKRGQWELFRQIEHNGTTVILTMNQLTDSLAFTDVLWDEKCYEAIISFFDSGRLKVSQYGEIRTVSQYLQNALKSDSPFKFSGIPIIENKRTPFQINEKQLLLEALEFSDLNRLAKYKALSESTEKQRIDYLYRYVKLILHISVEENIWVEPKPTFKKMTDWLRSLLAYYDNTTFENTEIRELWSVAETLLSEIEKAIPANRIQSRSEWFEQLKARASASPESDMLYFCFAEAIIDICYNISCESSISEVDKEDMFYKFQIELYSYWETYLNGNHKFCCTNSSENKAAPYSLLSLKVELPPFDSAEEILNDVEPVSKNIFLKSDISFTQKKKASAKAHRRSKQKSGILRFCVAIVSLVFFVILDFSGGWIQEKINLLIPYPDFIENIIMSVLFGIIFAVALNFLIPFLTKFILHSKKYEMDYLDVLKHLFSRIGARHKIIRYNKKMKRIFGNGKE